MDCQLTALATELQLLIVGSILKMGGKSRQSLINLSSTCSMYRSLLAPNIFHTITLQNNEKSATLAVEAANNHIAQHVKQLDFKPLLFGTPISPYSYFAAALDFPKSVNHLLANLHLFPKLDTLSIQFLGEDLVSTLWDDLEDPEPIERTLRLEKQEPWRRLMANTYKAICQNKTNVIRALQLKDTIPKVVSTFTTPEFRKILSTLESFSISLFGVRNDSLRCIGVTEGYFDFVSQLPTLFLNHLDSIKSLSIVATDYGPLGPNPGHINTQLPLRGVSTPNLESFSLRQAFICVDLLRFLASHAKTLKHVSLEHCYGSSGRYGNLWQREYTMRWSWLFNGIAKSEPITLQNLDVGPPKGIKASFSDRVINPNAYKITVQNIREILQKQPERHIFAYGILDMEHGKLMDCEEDNIDAFLRGDDQRAYDELIAILQTNRSNQKSKRRL